MPAPIFQTGSFAEQVLRQANIFANIKGKDLGRIFTDLKIPTANQRDFEGTRTNGRYIAEQLPLVKRLSCDPLSLKLIEAAEAIDTEEIVANLKSSTLPFERFWLEMPASTDSEDKIGFLVDADKVNGGFSFLVCTPTAKQDVPVKIFAARTHVSPVNGITLDDNAVSTYMDALAHDEDPFDASCYIDYFYNAAARLSCLFVALNSQRVVSNFCEFDAKLDREATDKNRRRIAAKRPPILATTPIIIDIGRTDPRLFVPTKIKQARELLGITSVARSKLVRHPDGSLWLRKKDGMPWSRRPHERRIPSPVDRRDAERMITTSQPEATLVVSPDRPAQLMSGTKPAEPHHE